jgi:hypothetical protein
MAVVKGGRGEGEWGGGSSKEVIIMTREGIREDAVVVQAKLFLGEDVFRA